MDKLFHSVQEAHDAKARVVHICEDKNGFYVFKPQAGFRSKHWPSVDDEALIACFERQISCGHKHGFYEEHEKPAADETYIVEEETAKGETERTRNKKPATVK